MKLKITPVFGMLLFCLLAINIQAQKLVKDVKINDEEANFQMADETPKSYLLEIGGPDDYYWKGQVNDTKEINLGNRQANGQPFMDGLYKLQVTPVYTLSPEQRTKIQEIRAKNDQKAMKAFREKHSLPENVNVYSINFSIKNGKFINPNQKEAKLIIPGISSAWEMNHPSLYASLTPIEVDLPTRLPKDLSGGMEDAQVFVTDVIIQGSTCTGFDCVNGESFGFDTFRMKENNLRINFDDTSSSASFPSNDWRIAANDTSNGGGSYLAIQDATAGNTPFRVEAGAGENALHVDASGGNIGMGTGTPVVELHVADGDSPTMRLEQNGTSGFTAQTWDVAGNETNFFVRDVTNGSKLPFKIRPGAPDNSIYTHETGKIGLGTTTPDASLDVERNNTEVLRLTNTAAASNNGSYGWRIPGAGSLILQNIATGGNSFSVNKNGRVGINTANASTYNLEVSGTAGKDGGGVWETISDRRYKTNIENFTDGLNAILKIRPVRYEFNGKRGLTTGKKFIGIIAQEMQEVAPYMITENDYTDEEGNASPYLSYNGSALTYMLVNAVKTQNDKIEQQAKVIKEQAAKFEDLQKEVTRLAELIQSMDK